MSDDEEHIIVTRPEEDELDPEAEADFERELAKMMSESMQETRKTDRKPMPDIALPIRRAPQVAQSTGAADGEDPPQIIQSNVVKFSLLSKRGNRAQVRVLDLRKGPRTNLIRPVTSTCLQIPISQSQCAHSKKPKGQNSSASRSSY
jgi:hypothetical protein